MENDEVKRIKQKKLDERVKRVSQAENQASGDSTKPRHLTDKDFFSVIGATKIALVDFYADWCGPCRMMAPIVETLAKEYSGSVLVAKINVDNNPEVSQKFGIASIPTFGIFKSGKLAGTIIGAVGKDALKSALDKVMRAT